jgi:hypothetical protein
MQKRPMAARNCATSTRDTNPHRLSFSSCSPTASDCHFQEAETSARRRFWAALGHGNLLDRASTYHPRAVTPSEFAPVAGEWRPRIFCSARGGNCQPMAPLLHVIPARTSQNPRAKQRYIIFPPRVRPTWPGAGTAPVSRGVRSLGSTCRRGDVADRRGPRHASPASAIEASSAVAVAKLDGAD